MTDEEEAPVLEGMVMRQMPAKNWKLRKFVLKKGDALECQNAVKQKGQVEILGTMQLPVTVVKDPTVQKALSNTLQVLNHDRSTRWNLATKTEEEKANWVSKLEEWGATVVESSADLVEKKKEVAPEERDSAAEKAVAPEAGEVEQEEEEQEEEDESEIEGPYLRITVHRGSCLNDVQWWGMQDPYVMGTMMPNKKSTGSTAYDPDGDTEPEWGAGKNNKLKLVPLKPGQEGGDTHVLIEVCNANFIFDDPIGFAEIQLADLPVDEETHLHVQVNNGGILECSVLLKDPSRVKVDNPNFLSFSMEVDQPDPEGATDKEKEKEKAKAGKGGSKGKKKAAVSNGMQIEYERHDDPYETRVLCLRIKSAKDLPDRQLLGAQDPYAEVLLLPVSKYQRSLRRVAVKTRPKISGGTEPTFSELERNMLFIVPGPQDTNVLKVQLWNDNLITDDIIASSDDFQLDYPGLETWMEYTTRLDPCGTVTYDMGWLESVPPELSSGDQMTIKPLALPEGKKVVLVQLVEARNFESFVAGSEQPTVTLRVVGDPRDGGGDSDSDDDDGASEKAKKAPAPSQKVSLSLDEQKKWVNPDSDSPAEFSVNTSRCHLIAKVQQSNKHMGTTKIPLFSALFLRNLQSNTESSGWFKVKVEGQIPTGGEEVKIGEIFLKLSIKKPALKDLA